MIIDPPGPVAKLDPLQSRAERRLNLPQVYAGEVDKNRLAAGTPNYFYNKELGYFVTDFSTAKS